MFQVTNDSEAMDDVIKKPAIPLLRAISNMLLNISLPTIRSKFALGSDYSLEGEQVHPNVLESFHGSLARYAKLRVRMRRECRERFPRHRR